MTEEGLNPLATRLESTLNAYGQPLENPPPGWPQQQQQPSAAPVYRQPQENPPAPAPVTLTARPGSRLEELQASYDSAKAAKEDAVARFDALTTAIKVEMAAAAPPGTTDITLDSASGLPRLRLKWLMPYRFDSKRFKAEHPDIYVRYEVRGGNWTLRQAD